MTNTINVHIDCQECSHEWKGTIRQNEVQTALSDYSNSDDAVQHFCGGEIPITSMEAITFINLVASFITINKALLEKHNANGEAEASDIDNCPSCGGDNLTIEINL